MSPMLRRLIWILPVILLLLATGSAAAQNPESGNLQVSLGGDTGFSLPVRIIILLTLLTFIPAILISMTSFVRIIVVVHFLRQALGTQQAPNNQILIGLTLFLTFLVMGPVWERIYEQSLAPYQEGKLTEMEALDEAKEPLRQFMLNQVREDDLALFVKLARIPRPKTKEDLPLRVVIPSFLISELKTAFQIGFVIFLPFLVIDMVISSVLLSMGMLQLPPIMISTPFKLLLFILVDGWRLIAGSLVESFKF